LVIGPVVVTIATFAFYGQTRIRLPAEPAIVLLAAVAVDHLVSRRRWRGPDDLVGGDRPVPAPGASRPL
jgi:hypothetical protein